jgi:putative two-component system response regulator
MTAKPKILVVDDEITVVMMMVFLLTRAGFDAQAASNAAKALRLAQTQVFDLITLDITMPGGNGFDLFRKLKKVPHMRDTPIIFVTGLVSDEDRQHALELGAVDYISKPFEATDFIFRIKSHTKAKNGFAIVPATKGAAT